MRVNIIKIGNSKGIRIPNTILKQLHVEKAVDLEVAENNIVLKPVRYEPRKAWVSYFEEMHRTKEDELLIPDDLDLETAGWDW